MKTDVFDLIVVGGGAAGFFGAINLAEQSTDAKILILEKSSKCLAKVRVSGGGRCNVTHACWDPRELVEYYPRGKKALLGPFHQFMCGDMMAWLADRGVETKIEDDGRVFPESNSSQTIIDCFYRLCEQHNIEIQLSTGLKDFALDVDGYTLNTSKSIYKARNVLMATGSSPAIWKMLATKEINIVPAIPSLFTFNIKSPLIEGLPGIVFPSAEVAISPQLKDSGPLLITHWGLSGPAVLKLSAWGARALAAVNYDFEINVNCLGLPIEEVRDGFLELKRKQGNKQVTKLRAFDIPKRFWQNLLSLAEIGDKNWADLSKQDIDYLCNALCNATLPVKGKSTFKEEFVSAGGVDLNEIHFKTAEHKRYKGLFFAGEVLDIDAVTGGFNFQAAWTMSWIAAKTLAERM